MTARVPAPALLFARQVQRDRLQRARARVALCVAILIALVAFVLRVLHFTGAAP